MKKKPEKEGEGEGEGGWVATNVGITNHLDH